MAETPAQAPSQSLTEQKEIDLKTIRSRIGEITKEIENGFEPTDLSALDRDKLLQDCLSEYRECMKSLETPDSNFLAPSEGLGSYLDSLIKEIRSVEEENTKLSLENGRLMDTFSAGISKMDMDLEECDYALKYPYSDDGLSSEINANQASSFKHHEFEMLELDRQIEESQSRLKIMQDLDNALISAETLAEASSMISDLKILEVKENCIKLFLTGPFISPDGLILGQKLDLGVEQPITSNHELLIEFAEETMELKKMEIFPDDVPLSEIFEMLKSSCRDFHLADTSFLGCVVRLVQQQIHLSTVRRLLLKGANKSRHSFEYSERDKMVTIHLVGGIDAFIGVPVNWPLSSAALVLISIKNSSSQSQNLTLPLVGRVKARANMLEHPRHHLVRFANAIEEILVQEMQSDL